MRSASGCESGTRILCAIPGRTHRKQLEALISPVLSAELGAKPKPEMMVLDVVVVVVLIWFAYGAGYFTREYMSRKHRAEARRWREYTQGEPEPEWLRAAAPANTNEAAPATDATPQAVGELGQMLTRWETRARARRAG